MFIVGVGVLDDPKQNQRSMRWFCYKMLLNNEASRAPPPTKRKMSFIICQITVTKNRYGFAAVGR